MDIYETFATWDKIAGIYQEKFMELSLYNETYDFICRQEMSPAGALILDAGCGPGNITRYLLQQRPDFRIDGIDVAPNMVELARKNNPAASFRVLDIRLVASLDKTYDGIVCGFCLPYLTQEDYLKFITDIPAIVKENGWLYISLVAGDPAQSGLKTNGNGDRVYFHYYDLDQLIREMEGQGFEKLRLFEVDYPKGGNKEMHTAVIFRKTDK